MKIFSITGYFNDDQSPIENYLVTELEGTPDGYRDDDIFFHGLSEHNLIGNHGDFTITAYKELAQ